MKTLSRPTLSIRIILAFAAVLGVAPDSFAAVKLFGPIGTFPPTTNVTAGVATNLIATVNIAGNGSGSTGYKGPVTFTLSVAPAEPTITLNVANNPVGLASVSSSTNAVLTVTTTALTPSNTYVVTIIADTNPPNASLVTPTNTTFTITMGTTAPFNPLKLWTGAGPNLNWSTAGNWSPSGPPGAANDAQFLDTGVTNAAGSVNNIVDTGSTIGSLTYGQIIATDFHTTLIASGATLTVSGTNGLTAGTGTDNGDAFVTVNTIKGAGGTLVVSNATTTVKVGQSHPTTGTAVAQSQATLDMSGLDTFSANVSRLLVGADIQIKGASGILYLARTNRVTATGATAPQIDVGDNTQASGSPAIPSVLLLGQTNAFFAGSIAVGGGKTDATGSSMSFNPSFANPVAYFRGTGGTSSRVGSWTIGDGFGSRQNFPNDCHGSVDFTLGTVDALVDAMYVGEGANVANGNSANVTGTGTISFNAGTINVNTLEIGYANTVAGFGSVNVGGGSLLVNTALELAHGAGSAGTLNVSSATVTANPGIVIGGGTAVISLTGSTLIAANNGATVGTAVAPVTTFAITNSTIKLAAQSLAPAMTVGTLSCGGGANTVSISVVPLITALPAQFPVIQYSTPDGDLSTFILGTLPSGAYQGYISNNAGNLSLDLVITNGPVVPALVWAGTVDGNWNTTTPNWKTNGIGTTYQQGYPIVRFDDTLTANSTISLTTTLTPGSLTVDNTLSNYTFAGSGKLSGSTGLAKLGAGQLTLAETGGNDFTGAVNINGGTLQMGNGGANGSLGAGTVSVAAGAALVFDRSDNPVIGNVISGAGNLTQIGAGVLTLNASNSAFAGEIVITQGTLKAGNAASLGTVAGGTTATNGGTLDVNGQQFNNTEPITAGGTGVGGNGAIINSTSNQTRVLRTVTLAADTTFGGSGDWDIHSSANGASDALLGTSGINRKLTKVGTNTVTIFGAQVDGMLGDIDVLAGTISFERNTTSLGIPASTVTVFTNATLQFQNASNIWDKAVTLKDGGALRGVNRDEFAGAVTLESGVGTVLAGAGAQLILDAAVGGAGGLTKNGAGILTLTSTSTYTGPTLLSQGTIALTGSGSIDSSTNITVSVGALLDLSALADPTLTLTTGRSLKGSGTIAGNVSMAVGSSLIVGGPGASSIGTMTITNNLALQPGSTIQMEVSKAGGITNNDQVVVTNVTYGGTLAVTGAGGAFIAGDTFKLFAAGSYGGFFNATSLPVGTTWDTSRIAVDGTIKVVSVSRPQFSSIAVSNGSPQLVFSGPAGNSYRLWASTNVAARPISSTWTLLVSNGLFNVNGAATFTDATATNLPARFYAISVP